MEKIDSSKKHQENLEDSVMYYQKETKEVAELLQKGNTNIQRKLTRIPFYRLEKIKKKEEEKLKNIHKTEKKKEKDLTKIGKGHDHHQVERRRYKRTKKQKELIEAQNHKEININNKENNKVKNINVKTEENEIDREKKKTKFNPIFLNPMENKNNINQTEHNTNNNKTNSLSRNYSDYYHDLKYTPSTINFTKKELRLSKKQQKIQFPEYTLSNFLSKEDKNSVSEMLHKYNMKKKGISQKKSNNKDKSEKSEKPKNTGNKNKQNIEKNFSDKKLKINHSDNNLIKSNSSSKKTKEKIINKIPSLDNIKIQKNNEKIIKDEENIIKEEIEGENEIEKENEPKKHSNLKLLRKKHKRMNKYKKAILKFRLAKKKAFCDAIEKDKNQMLFSNTFNADESISNIINNVLNQNINADDTTNNNNNTNINNDLNNLSIITENNNIQDKSQINNETNLSYKCSPILSHKKLENNIQNNSILNYYSNNNESNNITINSNNKMDISQKNNNSDNYININGNKLNHSFPNFQIDNSFNINSNNNLSNNAYLYNNPNMNSSQNTYINNNIYNYYYYPYQQFIFQNAYNNNNYNYGNNSNINSNIINNDYQNNSINNIKNDFSMNNSLPLPKNTFNPEFPSINLNFKKEKQKEKKINNYLEKLKTENNRLTSLNIDSMNGKELTSLIKENKNIDKLNLNLINLLLPEDQANTFSKKYAGLTKTEIPQENKNQTKKPIREYVDQILDKNFETVFSNFIVKLRDIYYKKKSIAPLKAKKRIVVGMREIEKSIKLKNILLLFVVPYIEKVEGVKNSMDERILEIFENCRKNKIPIYFGLNKFKLGQIARKKISAISMLGIVNVEGMENELKNIIKIGNELRKKWYLDNYDKKDIFKENKFIKEEDFELYHNMQLNEEIKDKNEIRNNNN